MVSEPWLCSLLSVSSAACRLIHSFSRLSLLRSSRQHLSCSSRTLASSCCSCLLLSVWVLRSLVAASDSARSKVFASSSWRPQKEARQRNYNDAFQRAAGWSATYVTVFLYSSVSLKNIAFVRVWPVSASECSSRLKCENSGSVSSDHPTGHEGCWL